MKLRRLDVRFYKAFNFDFERKWAGKSEPRGWEDVSEGWFPFIRIPIEPDVTAVVGANESGKSQLLDAVEIALTGVGIDSSDFCRYSSLYSVQVGQTRSPEFGVELQIDNGDDLDSLAKLLPGVSVGKTFFLYRFGSGSPLLLQSQDAEPVILEDEQLAVLSEMLPVIYRVKTQVGMPDSMSIAELAGRPRDRLSSRRSRNALVPGLLGEWTTPQELGTALWGSWLSATTTEPSETEQRRLDEFELGRKLLVDIARIDQSTFVRLESALAGEDEGEVEALVTAINVAIASNLNFQRWWTQDRDFSIEVRAREKELVFVIRDRTGSAYSFDERSLGLRYFLSYFVQLVAHRPEIVRSEVMLLDEPDAYLSSLGQQDLLRVLEDYVRPEVEGPLNQVVYVTHSPFLIDRNAGHRVRIIDKGAEAEGTRLVKDANQNLYEPLRTSLGTAVAETAFIGGRNLMVEGLADQVLLAGMSSHLDRVDPIGRHLNLNEVVVVPCGSAESIPFMIYLARGRDKVKPACVALFDGDKAGKAAAKTLRERLIHRRQIFDDRFVVELDTWASHAAVRVSTGVDVREPEDLITIEVAVGAARHYAMRFEGFDEDEASALTVEKVGAGIARKAGSLWDGLKTTYDVVFKGAHIEKVGFARAVLSVIGESRDLIPRPIAHLNVENNFALLLAALADLLDEAERAEKRSRVDGRLDREIAAFDRDHATGISKIRATSLLEGILGALSETDEDNLVRAGIAGIIRDFDLELKPTEPVANFKEFKERIDRLPRLARLRYQELADAAVKDRSAGD